MSDLCGVRHLVPAFTVFAVSPGALLRFFTQVWNTQGHKSATARI